MTTTNALTKQEQFFYDNAGYSHTPATETQEQGHIRSAREYAAAETWAIDNGYYFDWMNDANGCNGCDCGQDDCACATGEGHDTYGCIMRSDENQHLQSLWGICSPTWIYRRIIEAELALEEKFSLESIGSLNA